jgi:hypothetical protein
MDELLDLEHFGRPLEDYSPDEIAALKKELDARYANQVKQRIQFLETCMRPRQAVS